MVEFPVNPNRFDPYKNFKFRIKWDGAYIAGVSKISALKRTTEVIEFRDGGGKIETSGRRQHDESTEHEEKERDVEIKLNGLGQVRGRTIGFEGKLRHGELLLLAKLGRKGSVRGNGGRTAAGMGVLQAGSSIRGGRCWRNGTRR